MQFEDYFQFNYARYAPEPRVQGPALDDGEQSYIQRRLQERSTNQSEDIPEVQRYLTTAVAILQDQCPLAWWKVHSAEYPTIARMARDILSIPLTSVPVERLFSAARDILPYRRNRMGDKMITALLLTKSWDAAQAKYPILDHEVTPAHVEEGMTDLDPTELVVEKQALRYDADFLRRIVPVTGQDQDDSGSDSGGTTATDDDEFNLDQVEDMSTLLSSPSRSWASPATPGISRSF